MDSLAQDIASGSGESLSTLAELLAVPVENRAGFYSRLQSGFNEIYTSSAVQSADVIEGIYRVASNS